jgi:ribonucleotide monophosphatase NagD (HAD superfamily)
MLYESGSTSANTGVAPTRAIQLAVAKKLKGVVITSSPGFMSSAISERMRASVPDATLTDLCASRYAFTSLSNAETSGPSMNCADGNTLSNASFISPSTLV